MSPTFSDKVELKLIELAIEIEITWKKENYLRLCG